MEALIIFAAVFMYGYIGLFSFIYVSEDEEFKPLGSYQILLAILWPILAVKKSIELVKWVGRGLKEIYKFFIK
jgi:hypothetical protein